MFPKGGVVVQQSSQESAGFGWEVTNLHNDGADLIVPIRRSLVLHRMDFDCSYMILALSAPGSIEVLYTVGLSTGAPQFSGPPQAYQSLPASTAFGPARLHNPAGVQSGFDGVLYQGCLLRLILKSWAPADGTASQSARHVTMYPNLAAAAGNSLVFHMDHAGVPVDSEIQVALGYTLQT